MVPSVSLQLTLGTLGCPLGDPPMHAGPLKPIMLSISRMMPLFSRIYAAAFSFFSTYPSNILSNSIWFPSFAGVWWATFGGVAAYLLFPLRRFYHGVNTYRCLKGQELCAQADWGRWSCAMYTGMLSLNLCSRQAVVWEKEGRDIAGRTEESCGG